MSDKKYIVPQTYLLLYRTLLEVYGEHFGSCGMSRRNHSSNDDHCSCGFQARLLELKELDKKIKELNE